MYTVRVCVSSNRCNDLQPLFFVPEHEEGQPYKESTSLVIRGDYSHPLLLAPQFGGGQNWKHSSQTG